MLKIDIHTHILPKNIPNFKSKFGHGGFIHLEHTDDCCANMMWDDGTFFRKIDHNCWDADQRLKECDDTDVNVQVLSTVPVMFNYHIDAKEGHQVSQFLNDNLAETVQKNPKRFAGLGTLPMQDPDLAIKEAHRCIKDLKMDGFQIGSNINDENLSEEKFFPLYAELEKLDAALFVHPWNMMGKSNMSKYWLPWLVGMPAETSRAICSMIFSGVFEKFPKLKVAFAHGGGSFPITIGRVDHGHKVRPDLCAVDNPITPSKYLGRFFIDSLVHDPDALLYLINLFGADKIALGSDYPFPLGEHHPGELIESLGLHKEVKEHLLYKTALTWLGRKMEDFI